MKEAIQELLMQHKGKTLAYKQLLCVPQANIDKVAKELAEALKDMMLEMTHEDLLVFLGES